MNDLHTSPEKAVDADKARRPGNPMEREPAPVGNAHWLVPDEQPAQRGLTFDPSKGELTATFGSQHPPRGVSGSLRRAAYQLPDYRARRWLMLIVADRVDALEARLVRVAKHPLTWLLVAGGAATWLNLRKKPRRYALR